MAFTLLYRLELLMSEIAFIPEQSIQEAVAVKNAVEISVEEIEARENALSDTVYCCILNVAF